MLGRNAMQPNRRIARANFGVDCVAFAVSLDAAGRKPESFDEKIVRRRNVLVDENVCQTIDSGHATVSFCRLGGGGFDGLSRASTSSA